MINRTKIQSEFQNYVSNYDSEDPKVRLKIEHTYRVAQLCERIARSLLMSEEEIDIAWVCGMLHDIGRFEQIRRFHTFVDAKSVDHAKFGAELLFRKENLIRDYMEETDWDGEIEMAGYWHSAYRLPEDLHEKQRQFCQILRDADKLDILRVNVETPLEDIYNVTRKELQVSQVTSEVMKAVQEHHAVLRSVKKTPVDYVLGHICLIFELVYPKSCEILMEQGYLERLLNFESKNEETKKQFAIIRKEIQKYLEPMRCDVVENKDAEAK